MITIGARALSAAAALAAIFVMPAAIAAEGDTVQGEFSAKPGQSLVVAIEALALSPDNARSVLTVEKTDGTPVARTLCMTQPPPDMPDYVPPCKVAVFDVAEAGRYRVSLLASPGATVKGRVIVSEVVSGRLDRGKPVKLASMKPAQAARFTFEAKSGEKLGVSLNGIATTPRNSTVTLTLEQIEGGRFNRTITGTRGSITMPTADLRNSGKYAVIVDAGLAAIDSAELVVKEE